MAPGPTGGGRGPPPCTAQHRWRRIDSSWPLSHLHNKDNNEYELQGVDKLEGVWVGGRLEGLATCRCDPHGTRHLVQPLVKDDPAGTWMVAWSRAG